MLTYLQSFKRLQELYVVTDNKALYNAHVACLNPGIVHHIVPKLKVFATVISSVSWKAE